MSSITFFSLFLVILACSFVTSFSNCLIGSYKTLSTPFNECAGFRYCEYGSYCIDGVKMPCPGGTFGNATALNSAKCSGLCPRGFYCPSGTINGLSNRCGNSSTYCPAGSAIPIKIPSGYFGVGSTSSTFDSIQQCPKGFYCEDGIKHICPGGTFGNLNGLSSSSCSGSCPMSYYCPPGTAEPRSFPCSRSERFFCPEMSSSPRLVTIGFYAVNYSSGGGYGSEEHCPAGSYCIDGKRFLCLAGTFGSSLRSTKPQCDGTCREGYFCPPGSVQSRQVACGNASHYCPEGSGQPFVVSKGYYTVGSNEEAHYHIPNLVENHQMQTRSREVQCEPGHYCLEDGVRRVCPPGRFGSWAGLHSGACSGACEAGYYCPEGSTSPRQVQCGANAYFCPPGSKEPQPVAQGYYTVGQGIATRLGERKCEPGHFCLDGVKHFCAPGHWGGEFGQTHPACSGLCDPGYYCTEGSTSPQEVLCGDPDRYCPLGSPRPLHVPSGHYSTGRNVSTRSDIKKATRGNFASRGLLYICPAGRYGASDGESSSMCTGGCKRGFYCPPGSTSPIMLPCGSDNAICPPESAAPVAVRTGYYTTNQWDEGCKPGTWRNLLFAIDPSLPGNSFLPTKEVSPPCELCPNGTYKYTRGDSVAQCLPCPQYDAVPSPDRTTCLCYRPLSGLALKDLDVLYFNMSSGECDILQSMEVDAIVRGEGWSLNTSVTRYQEFECETGHFCVEGVRYPCLPGRYGDIVRQTDPQCTGVCPKGYFCPIGTSYKYSYICGGSNLYCPEGSINPLLVPQGFYSIGSESASSRFAVTICPPGYFCQEGLKWPCPVGRYTDVEGTIDSLCKDDCAPGYYCTGASPTPFQHECGSPSVFCPRGSSEPQLVHSGFYCDLTGANQGAQRYWNGLNLKTCSVELPCEPGSYCVDGTRSLCPPGRFGWRYGLNTSACSGECAPGYYCPSYLEPQPQAPAYTVWPRTSQLSAVEYKCGNVGYFCPKGAFYPLKVSGGYYTLGGDSDNTTRREQQICKPGFYCLNGIISPCPEGSYGATPGISSPACTGYCPAGFYCPEGCSDPIPCPGQSYSVGGARACSICPGTRTSALPCHNSRSCCFRGD